LVLLFAAGAFFLGCSEAETIFPGDETYYNPLTPAGAITTLTATASDLTVTNSFITITFSSPIDTTSVVYDGNVHVEYPTGTTRTVGAIEYIGITNSNKIIIDFDPLTPVVAGQTARITLTSAIKSYADPTISLSGALVFTSTVLP